MNDIHKLIEKYGAEHFLSGLFRILTFFGNVTRKELVACCYYIDRCCEAHSAYDIGYFDFHYEITQDEITVPELDNLICELKEIKPNGRTRRIFLKTDREPNFLPQSNFQRRFIIPRFDDFYGAALTWAIKAFKSAMNISGLRCLPRANKTNFNNNYI